MLYTTANVCPSRHMPCACTKEVGSGHYIAFNPNTDPRDFFLGGGGSFSFSNTNVTNGGAFDRSRHTCSVPTSQTECVCGGATSNGSNCHSMPPMPPRLPQWTVSSLLRTGPLENPLFDSQGHPCDLAPGRTFPPAIVAGCVCRCPLLRVQSAQPFSKHSGELPGPSVPPQTEHRVAPNCLIIPHTSLGLPFIAEHCEQHCPAVTFGERCKRPPFCQG